MKKCGMTVGDLKNIIDNMDDNLEIFISNSMNICGNISKLCEATEDNYGFFGKSIDCVILKSSDIIVRY